MKEIALDIDGQDNYTSIMKITYSPWIDGQWEKSKINVGPNKSVSCERRASVGVAHYCSFRYVPDLT